MFDLVAANALPQCLHTFRLELSSVSIKENIICMHNNKELKRAVPLYKIISDEKKQRKTAPCTIVYSNLLKKTLLKLKKVQSKKIFGSVAAKNAELLGRDTHT